MPRQKRNSKIVIGVTGSFGSGKSTVAGILKKHGASVIDADKLAHACIQPGSPAYKRIVSSFGRAVLTRKGEIDRSRLAKVVFNDVRKLRKLNAIIHPQVNLGIKRAIREAGPGIVVLDAPLLIEAGLSGIVDKLVVVNISQNKQISRIQKILKIPRAQIIKRIKCQMPLKVKVRLADFVIDNDGKLEKTRRQVAELLRNLRRG
jgi:dephospho-CoA kinase